MIETIQGTSMALQCRDRIRSHHSFLVASALVAASQIMLSKRGFQDTVDFLINQTKLYLRPAKQGKWWIVGLALLWMFSLVPFAFCHNWICWYRFWTIPLREWGKEQHGLESIAMVEATDNCWSGKKAQRKTHPTFLPCTDMIRGGSSIDQWKFWQLSSFLSRQQRIKMLCVTNVNFHTFGIHKVWKNSHVNDNAFCVSARWQIEVTICSN